MEGYGHEAGVKGGEACRRKGEDGRRGDEGTGEQVGSVVMRCTCPSCFHMHMGRGTVCAVSRAIMLSYGEGYVGGIVGEPMPHPPHPHLLQIFCGSQMRRVMGLSSLVVGGPCGLLQHRRHVQECSGVSGLRWWGCAGGRWMVKRLTCSACIVPSLRQEDAPSRNTWSAVELAKP